MQAVSKPQVEPAESLEATLERPLVPAGRWDWERGVYLAVIAVAALLRFWDLGSRAEHHDESLHALYSWYLYVGRGYVHDPLMHGPFQFHGIALIYFLLGAGDYTARVLAATLGTVAVALPYFLRAQLGQLGTLCAAALMAFSPSLLYYNRFAREDTYVLLWTLLLVVAIWGYLTTARRVYALWGAAALALGFATKETTYLTVLVFGSYLFVTSIREIVNHIRTTGRLDLSALSPRVGLMVMIGTLAAPQGGAAITWLWDKAGFSPAAWGESSLGQAIGSLLSGVAGGAGGRADPALVGKMLAATPVMLGLFGLTAWVGSRWDWRLWRSSAMVFYGIFIVLYTTFFTNLVGFGSGIWGGLEYWMAQQEVQRGSQPWFYYLMTLPLYEFLPLLLSFGGIAYLGVRYRLWDEFTSFCLWWFAGSLALYSYAGEKMPWLTIHMALPLILLGGKTLGVLLARVSWSELWRSRALLLAAIIPLVLLAVRALFVAGDASQSGAIASLPLVQVILALIALGVLLWLGWWTVARAGSLSWSAVGLLAVALLAVLTMRAAWMLSYQHGDIPVEMLVYTQTSPEVPRVMKQIERVASQTGQGKNLLVTVDAADGFTWPWAWYLRDYKNVDYPDLGRSPGEPRGTVVVLNANSQRAMEPFLSKYDPGQRFALRWWFPEAYKRNMTEDDYKLITVKSLQVIAADLLNGQNWLAKWSYFLYRTIDEPLGTADSLVYYPKGSAATAALGTSGQPAESLVQTSPLFSDQVLASRATAGLVAPRGIALDSQGNVYVVDSQAARVVKLDPSGRVLAQVGRPGTGDGEFTEPWGVCSGPDGSVYVADTWNHRVQKFDSELRFVTKWGSFVNTSLAGQQAAGFFGPRDLAVDSDGNILVTDTGNKRVQKFTPDGRLLASFGQSGRAPGQFQEPVGIAVLRTGEILVADTWNRRVQRFDRNFQYLGEFPVAGWLGQGLTNKPYLATDAEGNVLLTDPESHRLLRYSPAGALMNAYGKFGSDQGSFNNPSAIAIDAQGRVHVTDTSNSRVLSFPPLG